VISVGVGVGDRGDSDRIRVEAAFDTMDENEATFIGLVRTNVLDAGSTIQAPEVSNYLLVVRGGMPGAMIPLAAGETRIGRSSENNWPVCDPGVSRHHAVIRSDEERHRLIDLGSTNGTYLNGRRVKPKGWVALKDGDRIQLGSAVVAKFIQPDDLEEHFQREMFERTVRDTLTGLYNRAYFLAEAGRIAERVASRGLGLAYLMLDIDRFKRINDRYGHDVGDAVIREVADVIRQSTRPDDLVARHGGEEFAAALPVASLDAALDRAELIRAGLAARRIVVGEGRGVVRATLSIGLAYDPPGRLRPANIALTAADRALYRAKRDGRDRVASADQSSMLTALELPSTVDR